MKKLSLTLPQRDWGSLNTKFPANTARVDLDELTEGSKNFDTDTKGALVKRLGGVNFNDTLLANAPVDQYEAIFSSGVRHLLVMEGGVLRFTSGDGSFAAADLTHSSVGSYSAAGNMEFASYLDRVYFGNGINPSQVYDRTTSYGGVAYGTGPFTKDAGAQAPTTAPTFNADSVGGAVPAGGHKYKVTFLYYAFENSNGGPESALRTVAGPNFTVNLIIPVGGYGVTARNIYRDDNDGVFRLVGTVSDNTATTFVDTALIGTSFAPTDNGVLPTFSLIIQHKDRNWMAAIPGSPSTLEFTDAGFPDIVRSTNTILCNPKDPIIALAIYNDRIIVFNRNSFGQILGTTSDTFRYSEFPGSVGCVDNRTVQVRTIRGIPTLLWLSDRGFYLFNGSSVDYISEKIENLVNLNIQQAAQVKGQNTQTAKSQFESGTASPAILLDAETRYKLLEGQSGDITVPNPKIIWDDRTDWEGGSDAEALDTVNLLNSVRNPKKFAPDVQTTGSIGNLIRTSGVLTLPTSSDFTGEPVSGFQGSFTSLATDASGAPTHFPLKIAVKIIPTRSGTLDTFRIHLRAATTGFATPSIETDFGGLPSGTAIFTGTTIFPGIGVELPTVTGVGASLTGGVPYWLMWTGWMDAAIGGNALSGSDSQMFHSTSGLWNPVQALAGNEFDPAACYTFTSSPVATSGFWVSDTYDSGATTPSGTFVAPLSGSANGQTATITIDSSPDGVSFTQRHTYALGGGSSFAGSFERHWRYRIDLSTTDDRVTPSVSSPTLNFPEVNTWTSEILDLTTDILNTDSQLDSLDITVTLAAGTSARARVQTDDNAGFTSPTSQAYQVLSAGVNNIVLTGVTAERYLRIQIELTSTSGSSQVPSVSNLTFKWTIEATLLTQEIDTGQIPAGWDIFQSSFVTNGGTVQFELQSHTASGGPYNPALGDPNAVVLNGEFPNSNISPNQFAKINVTIIATADNVPVVSSVTLNWFIEIIEAIRAASLFFNRSYYMAAAEFNETSNNIVFKFDQDGKWRIYRGININTFSFFFNDPYYGSSTEGQLVKFLQGQTDQGTNIEFDVRTKAFNFDTDIYKKIVAKLFATGINTGATLAFTYSLDGGVTFLPLKDIDGNSSITTLTDNSTFIHRFVPNFSNKLQAPFVIFRVFNNDAFPVEIHNMALHVWTRQGDIT